MNYKLHSLIKGWILLLAFTITVGCSSNTSSQEANNEGRKFKAPELVGGKGWLNVKKPLTLKSLKGKVVLLDFWTFCCINCIHVIPDLKYLEKKYGHQLVVIGVHSAKFNNEKDIKNIRQAVLRHEIEHPVVNDADFAIWKSYGVRAWPSLVIIDPEGYVVGYVSGEGQRKLLDRTIAGIIEKHKDKINDSPIALTLEKDKIKSENLYFPGKILASEELKLLFISDSNHNRILITDFKGNVKGIIGDSKVGHRNGTFEEAQFNHPQGMALNGNIFYVADTENHMIREVNLNTRAVKTIAGTGKQVHDRQGGRKGQRQGLNSPWDLTFIKDKLYIAMAGTHQIWEMDIQSQVVKAVVGSGAENIVDGKLKESQLAQPSGLTSDGNKLYFADSEVSAIRSAGIHRGGKVKTLIGKGLFKFGDQDGLFSQALLQHPLGVAYHNKKLYVADTYNHKVKVIHLKSMRIETLVGNGKSGFKDGNRRIAQLYEPGGLSIADQMVFISDTNNHAIRVYNLKTMKLKTLKLVFNSGLKISSQNDTSSHPDLMVRTLPKRVLAAGAEIDVVLDLSFEKGYGLNKEAPSSITVGWKRSKGKGISKRLKKPKTKVSIRTLSHGKTGVIQVKADIYFCQKNGRGLCYIKSYVFKQPVTFSRRSKLRTLKFSLSPKADN